MKTSFFFTLVLGMSVAVGLAHGQDKPRVFVQGKGSEDVTSSGSGGGGQHWGAWGSRSTVDSHDEAMEITKDLQKNCGGVIVTLNGSNADYTIMLNRESKKNRGLLRSNSQLEVANRVGDVIGTNATHTVGNAAKDACQLIVSDWQAHGRMAAPPEPAQAAVPAPAAQPTVRQQGAPVTAQPVSATVPVAQPQTASSSPTVTGGSSGNADSLADAARRAKQHAQCVELAKDNPAITCN